ncbi:MAG: restriction endonuclease subunit S [Parabacteroides sp.]|nr:restriction endonuclease subunit S [Parabacteroides sp.]
MKPDGWREVRLGDLLNFRRGHDLPKTNFCIGKVPVVGSNGVIGYHNIFTTKSPCLTIGRSGNIGNPCFINKDCWAHNTTLYVDDYKNNDPKYLYYLLKTLDLGYFGGGSAVPTLNRNHIHPIMVKSTDNKVEQKAIAATLSCLDDKIELNNRINKALEEMAQAIFKSWFVDFEPFQDGEFEDSELGRIPKGWRVGRFTEVAKICGGGTPKTTISNYWNGNIPFFTPKDCLNNYYVINTEKTISLEGLQHCNSKLYPKDTVFVTARGTVGKICLAICDMAMNQSCYALLGSDGYSQYLIHQLTLNLVEKFKHKASGAVFDAIITRDFDSEFICIPPRYFLNQYDEAIKPLYSLIEQNQKEINSLVQTRDYLLPKLMSGEIRVPFGEVQ